MQAGQKLAHYEIVEPIGKGGMGEVYRARDTKLGRDVAIKVLPEKLARDQERLDRFEREARLLAQLNHANIATIHGLEEHEGQRFLVMELVEGETLAERIAQGPLAVDAAIPLFIQITEGLEAAHEKGILHRDLKPANIKIAADGKPKILDFGLAKALVGDGEPSPDSSQSPTLTKGTTLGTIMGTASYMSPEQARGKAVDQRTDVWAFGCCLYEALAGDKAFHEETVTDTISAVVRAEPEWNRLPPTVPASVNHILRLCLQKNRASRLRDIGDARILLEEPPAAPTKAQAGDRRAVLPIAAIALVVVLAASMAALSAWWLKPVPSPKVSRFSFTLPPGSLPYLGGKLAISNDGSRIAYITRSESHRQIHLRELDRLEPIQLAGAVDAHSLLMSGDASTVAFFASETDLTIKKLDVDDLTVTEYGEGIGPVWGATWAPDGSIYFATSATGLQSLPAGSNTVVEVAPDVLTERVSHPSSLPDSDWILLQVGALDQGQESKVAAFSLRTHELKTLVEGGASPQYAESGHLVFYRDRSLFAVAFDPHRLETSGEPVEVLHGVDSYGLGGSDFDISADGTLVYVPAHQRRKETLVWVDRAGRVAELLPEPKTHLGQPALSPDGGRIAVALEEETGNHIWIYETERGVLTRFTFEGLNYNPVWSPDGESLLFCSFRDKMPCNLFVKSLDASARPKRLTSEEFISVALSWTRDGEILFETMRERTGRDLFYLQLSDPARTRPLLESAYSEHPGSVSPDGSWLVYASDESGRSEIYIQRFPELGDKQQVSTGGGAQPLWARDGDEIFYRSARGMMSVPVASDDELELGAPVLLFEDSFAPGEWGWVNYDVHPDGERFAMLQPAVSTEPDEIVVVLNWFQELERLVPTGK